MKLEQIPSLRIVPDYLLSVKGGMSLQSIKDNFDVFDNDPGNIFFGIYDEDKIIGTIWFQVDDITKELFIIIFSLDKKYHSCDGYNIKALAEVARAIKRDMGLNKILWATTRPRAFEKLGFKRSKNVLMEAE